MARVRYFPLHPDELERLKPAVVAVREWQTHVRPFGPEYEAILMIKEGMNALAAATGAPAPFPRAG